MGYWNPGWIPRDEKKPFNWEEFAEEFYTHVVKWQGKIEQEVGGLEDILTEVIKKTGYVEITDLKNRVEELEELHYKNQLYPKDHNYPEPTHSEPKPHICGECEHTWEYTRCSPEAVSIVACRKNPKFDWKFHAVKKSQEACNEFRPRGES